MIRFSLMVYSPEDGNNHLCADFVDLVINVPELEMKLRSDGKDRYKLIGVDVLDDEDSEAPPQASLTINNHNT